MRKQYTRKKEEKKEKVIENKIPMLSATMDMYFKDKNSISNSLASLRGLEKNIGWKIIKAYFGETKQHLLKQLQGMEFDTDVELARKYYRTVDQIRYIDSLLTLPQLLIDSYREDLEGSNLDPYYNS